MKTSLVPTLIQALRASGATDALVSQGYVFVDPVPDLLYCAPYHTYARLGLRWRKPRIQLISQLPDGHLVASRAAGAWGQFVGLDDLQYRGSLEERIQAHHDHVAMCLEAQLSDFERGGAQGDVSHALQLESWADVRRSTVQPRVFGDSSMPVIPQSLHVEMDLRSAKVWIPVADSLGSRLAAVFVPTSARRKCLQVTLSARKVHVRYPGWFGRWFQIEMTSVLAARPVDGGFVLVEETSDGFIDHPIEGFGTAKALDWLCTVINNRRQPRGHPHDSKRVHEALAPLRYSAYGGTGNS